MEKDGLPVNQIGKSKRYDFEEVKVWIEDQQRSIYALIFRKIYHINEIAEAFKCSIQGGMRLLLQLTSM